jgi:hypothetical protein
MGQVIHLRERRPRGRREQPAPLPSAAAWPPTPAAYAQHLLEPSWALWRSLVASYASFWFAPLGIEVKVGEDRARRGEKARLTSGS